MKQEIRFDDRWDRRDRNNGRATKGNIENIIGEAQDLRNGGPLRRAPRVIVLAGVHKSPGPAQDRARRPGGGIARGVVGDWHWHITVDVPPASISSWHINVMRGKHGRWYPISLYKRPGERHFEAEPGPRRV